MAIRTVKVCEECGKQTAQGDSWLIMTSIEIMSASNRSDLVHSENIDLDFCSPGCLLRYISRSLELAQSRHTVPRHGDIEKLSIAATSCAA
ncbi:MAG: hypothetical protein ABFD54_01720 [Armatimonadota bacterium]